MHLCASCRESLTLHCCFESFQSTDSNMYFQSLWVNNKHNLVFCQLELTVEGQKSSRSIKLSDWCDLDCKAGLGEQWRV